MKDSLLKKYFSFSYGSIVGLIIGLGTTVITTRILNPEQLGKASMFTTISNLILLVVLFGMDQSFIRYFYEEEKENRKKLLYKCIKLSSILIIPMFIGMFIFRDELIFFLFGEYNSFLLLIIMLNVLFQLIYRYATLVIRMNQKGNLFSNLEIVHKFALLLLILIFYLLIGEDYKIMIYATIATFFIVAIVGVYFERFFWFNDEKKVLQTSIKTRELFKFAIPLFFTSVITWLFQSFDKVGLRAWSNFQEIGLYSAAFKIVALLSVLQVTFSTFWTPIAYESYEKNPRDTKIYTKMFSTVSFAMLILAAFSIALKDIIVLFLGNEYKDASNIMPFLIFMPMMYTISEITVVGINFKKVTYWHFIIVVLTSIMNITGNYILIPTYGALGAATSTGVSYIFFFILRTLISQNYYKIPYNFKRFIFCLILLILYSFLSSFVLNGSLNIIVGFIIVLFLIFLHLEQMAILLDKIKRF